MSDEKEAEEHKNRIYKHPLFPVLSLLMQKCVAATADPSDACSPEDFRREAETLLSDQTFNDDQETNDLMLVSLEVLWLQLHELSKVHELCSDFCARYISCLRSKMHSEHLLQADNNNDNNNMSEQQQMNRPKALPGNHHQYQPTTRIDLTKRDDDPSPELPEPEPIVHSNLEEAAPHLFCPLTQAHFQQMATSILRDDFDDDSESGEEDAPRRSTRARRRVSGLPKASTAILKAWLFQHLLHPYPREDEKRCLAQETGLSLSQINTWFINARRRVLQPLMDSNSASLLTNNASLVANNQGSLMASNELGTINYAGIQPPWQEQQQNGLINFSTNGELVMTPTIWPHDNNPHSL